MNAVLSIKRHLTALRSGIIRRMSVAACLMLTAMLWEMPARGEVLLDTTGSEMHRQTSIDSVGGFYSGVEFQALFDTAGLDVEFIVTWRGGPEDPNFSFYQLVALVQSTNGFIAAGALDPNPIAKVTAQSVATFGSTNWSIRPYSEIPVDYLEDDGYWMHNYRLHIHFELTSVIPKDTKFVVSVGFPTGTLNIHIPAIVGSNMRSSALPAGVNRYPFMYTRDITPSEWAFDVPQVKIDAHPLVVSAVTSGTNLVLGWPSFVTNGAIQATTSLDSMNWSDFFSITSATNSFAVPMDAGSKFFRIRLPQ